MTQTTKNQPDFILKVTVKPDNSKDAVYPWIATTPQKPKLIGVGEEPNEALEELVYLVEKDYNEKFATDSRMHDIKHRIVRMSAEISINIQTTRKLSEFDPGIFEGTDEEEIEIEGAN